MISRVNVLGINSSIIPAVRKNFKSIEQSGYTKNGSADILKYMPQYIPFKGLNSVSEKQQNLRKIDFKEYFEKGKFIPAEIWENGVLMKNSEAENYVKALDNLDSAQKKEFVKEFCLQTGFPDLDKVKSKIDKEIIKTVNNVCRNAGYKPLFIGYSSACSAGRGTALPGSDCDGLFIAVDKKIDFRALNRAILGDSINQRLINAAGEHYPELFNIHQLMEYVQLADKLFKKFKTPGKIESYKKNLLRSDSDFIKAGGFNIDLAAEVKNPKTKNMLYLTSLFVEELRAGNVLINNLDKETLQKIKSSALYKYSNAARQEGFQNNTKAKWENRKKLCKKFPRMNPDEQFEICREIFKSSLGIVKAHGGNCFEYADLGNIKEFINIITEF